MKKSLIPYENEKKNQWNPIVSPMTFSKETISSLTLIALCLIPTFHLFLPKAGRGLYILLSCLGLFLLCKSEEKPFLTRIWPEAWGKPWFLYAFLAWAFLICKDMALYNHWGYWEAVAKLLCPFALFPLLRQLPSCSLIQINRGLITASIFAVCIALFVVFYQGEPRAATPWCHAISFGNTGLLLGFWSLISLSQPESNPRLHLVLKLTGFFSGLLASFLSGSRGGWIAIPFFCFLSFSFLYKEKVFSRSLRKGLILGSLVLVSASYPTFINRLQGGQSDLVQYEKGNANTSLGLRLEMWKGALLLAQAHPWTGIGWERFQLEMGRLAQERKVDPAATSFTHPHNESLMMLCQFGGGGLVILWMFYLSAWYHFYRWRHHPDSLIRSSAHMGMILMIGLVLFGLSDMVIGHLKYFFILMLVTFLSLIDARQREKKIL